MEVNMGGVDGTVRVTERIHLLSWQDALKDRRVVVSIVLPEDVRTLDQLAARVHLGDLVEAVRKADEKLPRADGAAKPADGGPDAPAADGPAADPRDTEFDLPERLRNLRFVVPDEFFAVTARAAESPAGLAPLHAWLTGGRSATPLGRLGILGRALAEERVSPDSAPWTLATLLVSLRTLADAVYKLAGGPAKLREAFDAWRNAASVWTAKIASESGSAPAIRRLMANPLAPFALRRASPPPDVGEIADQLLDKGNAWKLTREAVGELDARFDGAIAGLIDAPDARDAFRGRVQASLGVFRDRADFDAVELAHRNRSFRRAGIALLGVPLLLLAVKLADGRWSNGTPFGIQLTSPETLELVGIGAVAGGALGLALMAAMFTQHLVRLVRSPACKHERALRADLRKLPAVRALVEPGAWTSGGPALLGRYATYKDHCLDYHLLTRLDLPPLDRSSMYETFELRDKWGQNACACFADDYPSLVIGASQHAAVYFVDVVGSTEISTKATLSNALEIYGRMLRHANETGQAPMWRKEIGDGRIYCHPASEALKRALLTVQGAAHPRIGLSAGIGLSVGEIYRDVTTGDFLNEVTNRASRLNARVEAVGAWAKARWPSTPHRVFVKWGLLYNAGIALDDRALAALGADGPTAEPPAIPFEWRFPAPGEPGANIHWLVERVPPAEVADLAIAAGLHGLPGLKEHGVPPLAFEAFCSRSSKQVRYATHLDGASPEEYLARLAVEGVFFHGTTVVRDLPVRRYPVTLPSGDTIHLAVKSEQAVLKGVGSTVIAEAEVPPIMIADPEIRLAEFLAGSGAAAA